LMRIGCKPRHASVGDKVIFSISEEMKKGGYTALEVSIRHEPPKQKDTPSLGGFPCIRGSSIRGFIVIKDLGHIETSKYFSGLHATNLQAENALIQLARSKGANAIFYYRWTLFQDNNYLFWPEPSRYGAEGNAVLLAPIDR
jgi:hypothetical protein